MTNAIILFVFLVSAAYFPETPVETSAVKPHACSFFTYANAEKLLGQKVTGADTEENKADGGQRWNCTFTADSGEGKIYFALFKDPTEEAARNEFQKIRTSNQKHKGFEDWPEIGDEAIVHTDGQTFQFIMVRKGTRTIRIKLNPMGGASLDDVKAVATSLAAKLR